ncbi:MAG: UDP-N-acetylmuramoylalanine--D-glutamate ligase [Pedosphaera sp.]|nr:UDP-N-acetylmuramoylalanine--D-glutamate ligase [Pedosphaera sp.]
MYELADKKVLVIGLGARGRAACELLRGSGANVMAIDKADNAALRAEAVKLRALGVEVELGVSNAPDRQFALAVVSPAVSANAPIVQELARRQVQVIGEFELGYQQSHCLNVAVAGTNGKATTGELIERVLVHSHRKTALCGHGALPICSVVPRTKELDFMILQVNSFQLETTRFFRPAVAVLLNLAPDHMDRYASAADYARTLARLFQNQQAFDWAVIQSEALAQLRALDIPIPGKVITFSANNRRADIYLDRGLLISRLPDWSWPLLDMAQCQLRGPHNAENLMAALAVGHVLHLPLDAMAGVLKAQKPDAHCCEEIAEVNGVTFINDSKATNVDALEKALLSVPTPAGGQPNVWLIAGGKDKGSEYHYVGPLISQRVKGAFLIGEAREKIRAAWSLFTPCTVEVSLLEAVQIAVKNAVPGDVILLSPACSSFDQFRNYQERGEVFRRAVNALATATGGGIADSHPNMQTVN